jgi:predicted methyltransferase
LGQILHDFANNNEQAAIALLSSLRRLVKPGGSLVVIDHAGDEEQDNTRLHRMTLADAQSIAIAAGFTLVAESNLLANPRDRRRRPVFDPMLARNTDRFLLRFTR